MKATDAYRSTNFWLNYWRLMEPFRARLKRVLVWILILQVLALIEPAIVMFIVDDITKHGSAAEARLLPLCLTAFVALIAIGMIKVAKDRRVSTISAALFHDLPIDCSRKLLNLPLTYHLRTNAGEIVGKVTRGTERLVDLTFFTLLEIIPLGIQIVISIGLLLYLHPTTALALVPPIIAFGWLTHRFKRATQTSRKERHHINQIADARLGQAATNIMTVQAFSQELKELLEYVKLRDRNQELFLKDIVIENGRVDLFRNSLISLGRIGLIAVCAHAVFGNVLTIGVMILMVTLAERIFINCYRFGGIYDRVMDAEEPASKIIELLQEVDVRAQHETSIIHDPDHRFEGRIQMQDVSFAYPQANEKNPSQAQRYALQQINLDIRVGQMIGIVGYSGGGKSTLMKLLLGFHAPTHGTILLDGHDVQRLFLKQLRGAIGLVPQEVELFDDTIRANIAYGMPNASDEDIVHVAKAARAHEFIMQAGGYNTIVGDRGLRLSGGQRQRLGIARALLRKPAILIFDEATSNIDPENIAEIKKAIQDIRGRCTLIIVSHQLATIQDADQIVVVNGGRIDGVGQHRELVQKNRIYCGLVQQQQRYDLALWHSSQDPARPS